MVFLRLSAKAVLSWLRVCKKIGPSPSCESVWKRPVFLQSFSCFGLWKNFLRRPWNSF